MQDKKIKIRFANSKDNKSIFIEFDANSKLAGDCAWGHAQSNRKRKNFSKINT